MIGTLSQLVALCSAANGVITDRFDPQSFYPGHADFKFCNSVRFVDVRRGVFRKAREVERHGDPNDWLFSLKQIGARKVWLTYAATGSSDMLDHQLAAFVGGGGHWQLVVALERKAEFWMSRWDVTNQHAKDHRIWSVTYGCIGKTKHNVNVPESDLTAATIRLRGALDAVEQFAIRHDLPSWAEGFQRAIECFDLTKPLAFPDYVQFVCLESYPLAAQRLFAAAYNGWVFGGMGSWNDLYFEPPSENDRYNDLTAELYSAINDSIQQATWSSKP